MNKNKPDLSRLKIFGSRVQIQTPGGRKIKVDRIINECLFMTHTGIDKIGYVVNNKGQREKSVTHVSFDEEHMSSSLKSTSLMGVALQKAGHHKTPFSEGKAVQLTAEKLKVKLLSNSATLPQQSSEQVARFDICSAENTVVQPGEINLIHTNIALQI